LIAKDVVKSGRMQGKKNRGTLEIQQGSQEN
jgi:hypothetical protein